MKALPSRSPESNGEKREGKYKQGSIGHVVDEKCYKEIESRSREIESEREGVTLKWPKMSL